jgi:glycosyltransferase involved in cell wall biosynthesis
MLLSVIIPVYNVELYIEKCINSIVTNDLEAKDYEIIVVDDGSPDNSVSIVRKLSGQHDNIRIISQANKGLGGARNTGVQNAIGDYILFLDADDWINNGMLASTVRLAAANNLDVLEFGAEGISVTGKVAYRKSQSSKGKVVNGFEYVKNHHYMWSACNKLYRSDFLKKNELYFEEHIYFEDLEFFARMIPHVKRVEAISDIVASFYLSGDSITRNNSDAKKKKAYADIVTIAEKLHSHYLSAKATGHADAQDFYLHYLGILIATLFYQFIKNKESYDFIVAFKKSLVSKGLYYTSHKIEPLEKDIFRRIFLRHFYLFKVIAFFRKKKH